MYYKLLDNKIDILDNIDIITESQHNYYLCQGDIN